MIPSLGGRVILLLKKPTRVCLLHLKKGSSFPYSMLLGPQIGYI